MAESQPLYAVIAVTQTTAPSGKFGAEPAYEIEFHVLGQEGHSVTIPASEFNLENVKAKLEEVASAVASVLSMAGPDIQIDVNGQPVAPMS